MDQKEELVEVKAQLADAREALFLSDTDLKKAVTENIALKNFIQNLYESCENVDSEEIDIETILSNLKENIRVFARVHFIRL